MRSEVFVVLLFAIKTNLVTQNNVFELTIEFVDETEEPTGCPPWPDVQSGPR